MVRTSLGALARRHRLGFSLLGIVATCAVVLPACGDGGSTPPFSSVPTTMTILVTSAPTTGTVLVGTDRQYAIEVRDAFNVVMPAYTTAAWSIVGTSGIATITPSGGLAPCMTAGTVSVHAVGPAGANGVNLTASTSLECVQAPAPDLSITKVGVVTGNDVFYTLTITNNGTGATVGPVTFQDSLPSAPAGVVFNMLNYGPPLSCSGFPAGPVVCTVAGSIGPGVQLVMGLNLKVPPGGGTVTNCASVAQAGAAEVDVANNRSCATSTVAALAGSITIVKDAQPNDGQNFGFVSNHPAIPDFLLDDDADATLPSQRVFANLPAGSYAFTETQVAPWSLASITCTPSGSATTNLTAGAATIALTAGANVVCTFVNTAPPAPTTGSITIVKNAEPNDAQNFVFTTTGSGLSNFLLDDDSDGTLPASKTFSGLATDVPFTVTEGATSGWTLTGVTCTQSGATGAAGASITYPALGVAISLAAGANVVCTFTNTAAPLPPAPDLSITKLGVVTGQSVVYTITITNNGTTSAPGPITMLDSLPTVPADVTWAGATAGCASSGPITCSSAAALAAGAHLTYSLTVGVPATGGIMTNCAAVTQGSAPGLAPEANISNNRGCATDTIPAAPTTGSITIVKNAEPNGAQDFMFTSNQATIPAFSLDDDGDPTLAHQRVFTSLPAGSYTFTEAATPGWNLTGISCLPSAGTTTSALTGSVTVALTAGANVVCTFTNTAAPAPAAPNLSVTKVGVVSSSAMGQVITYTITVTNNGTGSAPGPIILRDTLPSTPVGVLFSGASGYCSGPFTGPIVCTSATVMDPSGALAPGAQLTHTITLTVPAGGGTVTNCASVAQGGDAMTPPEPNLTDNRACTTNTMTPPAPATATITIVKDAQPNDPQDFHFTTVGAGMSGFDLDDDADPTLPDRKTFTLAAGGTYTVTEGAVAGWTVPSLQCLVAVPGATLTSTDQLNRTFTISNLEAGAVVTCTFINVK